jgi:hypothetical protein
MRGVLYKQKFELREQKQLQKLAKEKDYSEMQNRIKEYQEEVQNELDQRMKKRNWEIEIMVESKDMHTRNTQLKKQLEKIETQKESPKYLEQREQQERDLSTKRNSDRKALNSYYKQSMHLSKL